VQNVRWRNRLYIGKIINTRAQLLDATNLMDDASIDPYAFQRDSWLQMRNAQINGKEQINYDEYLDYLSEGDEATDNAVNTSENHNQTESDTLTQFENINSVEENRTSQRPLASHLVSSL
jgi:hypothetical protein